MNFRKHQHCNSDHSAFINPSSSHRWFWVQTQLLCTGTFQTQWTSKSTYCIWGHNTQIQNHLTDNEEHNEFTGAKHRWSDWRAIYAMCKDWEAKCSEVQWCIHSRSLIAMNAHLNTWGHTRTKSQKHRSSSSEWIQCIYHNNINWYRLYRVSYHNESR